MQGVNDYHLLHSYTMHFTELETILNTSLVKMELYGHIVWEKIKKFKIKK